MKECTQRLPDIPVIILCGGKGTRLRDVTELLPKPMVPIGEQPILWHIMKSYASFGIKRFILCIGYKQEVFIDYFMNFHLRMVDATINLGHNPEIRFQREVEEADWSVTLAQTGVESKTGLRVARTARYLRPDDHDFFLTYGDGLADVNLAELYQSHLDSGKLLTISAVHPPARFGAMKLEGDSIVDFDEKVTRAATYINGGFMAIKREFIERYLSLDEDVFLEQTPFSRCVKDKEAHAFRHEGFWQCMDTPREFAFLNDLWRKGDAPWTKYWER